MKYYHTKHSLWRWDEEKRQLFYFQDTGYWNEKPHWRFSYVRWPHDLPPDAKEITEEQAREIKPLAFK